jgi:hypothetical protein
MREVIALRIIDMAQRGTVDQKELADSASFSCRELST